MLAHPKKKNISKGGGEYNYADSGTKHQPTPCKQVTAQRAIEPGTSAKTPGQKGGRYVTGVTESTRFIFVLKIID